MPGRIKIDGKALMESIAKARNLPPALSTVKRATCVKKHKKVPLLMDTYDHAPKPKLYDLDGEPFKITKNELYKKMQRGEDLRKWGAIGPPGSKRESGYGIQYCMCVIRECQCLPKLREELP